TFPKSSTLVLKYDAAGEIKAEAFHDPDGLLVQTFHYTDKDLAYYTDRHGLFAPRSYAGASHVRLVRDEQGLEREVWFLDSKGQPQPDRYGVYGQRLEYDEYSLPKRVTWLDAQGKPTASKDGYARVDFTNNKRGERVAGVFFDAVGKPALD